MARHVPGETRVGPALRPSPAPLGNYSKDESQERISRTPARAVVVLKINFGDGLGNSLDDIASGRPH